MPRPMRHFRFWCQSVLPIVYDDSLSYYEVLCKIVDYINKLIDTDKEIFQDLDELRNELDTVNEWINTFDTTFIESVIREYLTCGVYFGLTNDGYFVAYIPDGWNSITFETTGYDVNLDIMPEYGHLCLSY